VTNGLERVPRHSVVPMSTIDENPSISSEVNSIQRLQ
jgi:hypothetical protein